MINRPQPVCLTQGEALIIRYRNEWRVGKTADHLRKARHVHALMAGCQKRYAKPTQERQVQPIDMHVDDIEVGRVPGNRFQQRSLGNHRVRPWAAEAKSPRPDSMELGGGLRISAGEQRHLMPQAYQFIDQPRHHTLGAAVKLGRNTFGQRRYLGNSHRLFHHRGIRDFRIQIGQTTGRSYLASRSSQSSNSRLIRKFCRTLSFAREPICSRRPGSLTSWTILVAVLSGVLSRNPFHSSLIWCRMPPTSPPIAAAPFLIASVTVSPKPSRVDFCRTTAADRCSAFTRVGSSTARTMMPSSATLSIVSRIFPPSGSSEALLPTSTSLQSTCSLAFRKASMTPIGSFHASNLEICVTSGRSVGFL